MGAYGSPELYPYNSDDNNKKKNKKNRNNYIAYEILMILLIVAIYIIYTPSLADNILTNVKYGLKTVSSWGKSTYITDTALRGYKDEQSEEYFRQSCSDIDYKEFMRYPEKHVGDKVKLECKVVQNVTDTLGNFVFYRVQTKDDNGYWYGNEYVIIDDRSDHTRILEDDLIIVYGKFNGMKTVRRVVGQGYNSELPAIKMVYADIASEEERMQADIEARALQYVNNSALSKNRIMQEMGKEGYSENDLTKALKNIDVDWNEQAVKAANWYIGIYPSIDRETLREQLTRNEGFTGTETECALDKVYRRK